MQYQLLKINNTEASTWGLHLQDGALSALLTPLPKKSYITNESRLEDGATMVNVTPRDATADLSLPLLIVARTAAEFKERYLGFLNELSKGTLAISFYLNDKGMNPVRVEMLAQYNSCSQYTQYHDNLLNGNGGFAKFTLKLKVLRKTIE